jgi:hypothetical protein
MSDITKQLNNISTDLKGLGLEKTASIVQNSSNAVSKIKTAQYVGAQGYAIRNGRCFHNCYRHKRATKPDSPAQVVWGECWDEYNKSINNDKSGWETYAAGKKLIKNASLGNKLSSKIESKVKEGASRGEAIISSLEEDQNKYNKDIMIQADTLSELAASLNEGGYTDIGIKLSEASLELMKEAQFMEGVKDFGRGLWRGMKGKAKESLPGRAYQGVKNIQERGAVGKDYRAAIKNIKGFVDQVNYLDQARAYARQQLGINLNGLQTTMPDHASIALVKEWMAGRTNKAALLPELEQMISELEQQQKAELDQSEAQRADSKLNNTQRPVNQPSVGEGLADQGNQVTPTTPGTIPTSATPNAIPVGAQKYPWQG